MDEDHLGNNAEDRGSKWRLDCIVLSMKQRDL